MDLAIRAMRIRPSDHVLDVGCGPGDFLLRLAQAVDRSGLIVGLDHSPVFLDEGRALVALESIETPVDFVDGDALALPFPDASFDSAHTERVLIHLSDPDRGLRELRRVTKPGGWVVCVEPDLIGWRIDHQEPALARLLLNGFTQKIRFPAMGLELNRRMAEAGFVDRTVETLTEVEREFTDDSFANFQASAKPLIADGRMTRAQAKVALKWLSDQSEAGRYTSYTSMFIVSGRVPTTRADGPGS
jgi:ubiquinone/menaquinone biosynthesis C-methylase UbiE